MPYVKVELIKGRTEEQKAAMAEAITEALVKLGGAAPQSVWVVFDDVEKENWATGGKLMSRK
jgi:4-oxalocrotonate tautomerase